MPGSVYDLPAPGPSADQGFAPSSAYDLPEQYTPPAPAQGAPEEYHGQDLWLEEQQRERAAQQRTDAAGKAELEAHRAQLAEQHGVLETITTQGARGLLDALLAPGALLGASIEATGSAWNSKTLEDFGRDLGKASSGRSAFEAGAGGGQAALDYVFGTDTGLRGNSALAAAESAKQAIHEQEEARPMLSTISRMAGMAFGAVATGAGASAESGTAATIAANALEGAAGGAQGAYEQSAPLRDVLSSAAVGGLLGGGLTAGVEGLVAGARAVEKRLPDLQKVFGERLQSFADDRAIKAVIDRDPKAWKRFLGGGEERLQRVAERIRAADVLGKGDDAMLEALQSEASKAGDDLAAVAQHLDSAGVKPDVQGLMQSWDEQVAKLRSSGSGTNKQIADALEREVAPFKQKLAITDPVDSIGVANSDYIQDGMRDMRVFRESYAGKTPEQATRYAENLSEPIKISVEPGEGAPHVTLTDGRHRMTAAKEAGASRIRAQIRTFDAEGNEIAREIRPVSIDGTPYREPTFSELRSFKQALGAAKSAQMRSQSLAADEISKLYGSTAKALNEAADSAGPQVSKLWRQSNEAATDYIELSDALERQIARKAKNRFISPSDYGTGIAAGLASMIHASNPITAVATAVGGALGHHALREAGSHIASSLANRFARMSVRIPLAKSGGPEMQEVLQSLAKTRQFAEEVATQAGDNPAARQAASDLASNVAAGETARRAGSLDLSKWADKPPSPMQKVLYRGQILDRVSTDVSKAADELAALHPEMPQELDPARVGRLMRDADAPAAIGGLQQTTAEQLADAPPTPTGSAAAVSLRRLANRLETADAPEAMVEAHQAALLLDNAAAQASDDASRAYAQRTALALRDALSSESFGSAGREYAALAKRPSDILENLSDPQKLREALRQTDANGTLPKAINQAQQQIAAAHDAAFKLAGQRRPDGLAKVFKRNEKLADAAEQAVTLDGKPMARLFDAANSAGVYHGTTKYLHPTDVGEHTVRDTIDEKIDKIAPAIASAGGFARRKYRPVASVPASVAARRAAENPQQVYDRRIEMLAKTVNNPSAADGHVYSSIGPDVGSKMAQLLNDMPKPTKSLMGSVGSQLSRSDLQLANAMWEATTDPLSVFDDFASGDVDYRKVSYAWKQYPGLQAASQAGVLDYLSHDLDDEEREKIPAAMLTQLDNLLGFGGRLQTTLQPGFAQRMSQMYQPAPPKGQPGGMLDTAKSEPTFTERLAGAGAS